MNTAAITLTPTPSVVVVTVNEHAPQVATVSDPDKTGRSIVLNVQGASQVVVNAPAGTEVVVNRGGAS